MMNGCLVYKLLSLMLRLLKSELFWRSADAGIWARNDLFTGGEPVTYLTPLDIFRPYLYK